jgi:DNA-binding NarL/FixJ family response regulator
MTDDAERTMKVLVVDDSLDLQRSLATLLAPILDLRIVGYAEDAAGALERVARLRPDLIVLDVALRDDDRGIDVLRQVVREHAHIKVVVLSNFTWGSMRDGLLNAGAHAYFDKSDEFIQARDWIAAQAHAHVAGALAGAR